MHDRGGVVIERDARIDFRSSRRTRWANRQTSNGAPGLRAKRGQTLSQPSESTPWGLLLPGWTFTPIVYRGPKHGPCAELWNVCCWTRLPRERTALMGS